MCVSCVWIFSFNASTFCISHCATMRLQPVQEHLRTELIQPACLETNVRSHLINEDVRWFHRLPTILASREYVAKKKQCESNKHNGGGHTTHQEQTTKENIHQKPSLRSSTCERGCVTFVF